MGGGVVGASIRRELDPTMTGTRRLERRAGLLPFAQRTAIDCSSSVSTVDRMGQHHLPCATNFRDVGGYTNRHGDTVQRNRLYRSDSLTELDDRGVILFRDLEVATVIDLRSDEERERFGVVDGGRLGVDVKVMPIIDELSGGLADAGPADLGARYEEWLVERGDRFGKVVRAIAIYGGDPLVVQCTAGKDRTGMVVALLLGLLDVEHDAICRDYGLSAVGMRILQERFQSRMTGDELAAASARQLFSADPTMMAATLDALERRFGDVATYLDSVGVDEPTRDLLRARYLCRVRSSTPAGAPQSY